MSLDVASVASPSLLALRTPPMPWHRGLLVTSTAVVANAFALHLPGGNGTEVLAYITVFGLGLGDPAGSASMRISAAFSVSLSVLIGAILAMLGFGHLASETLALLAMAVLAGGAFFGASPWVRGTRMGLVSFSILDLVWHAHGRGPEFSRLAACEIVLFTWAVYVALCSAEHAITPDRHRDQHTGWIDLVRRPRATGWVAVAFTGIYAGAVCIAWLAGHIVDPLHPVWVSTSALMVMVDTVDTTMARAIQRIVGTAAGACIGVLVSDVLSGPLEKSVVMLMLTWLVPYAMASNYWLHCALVAVMALLGLDILTGHEATATVGAYRVVDNAAGAVIAWLAVASLLRRRPSTSP